MKPTIDELYALALGENGHDARQQLEQRLPELDGPRLAALVTAQWWEGSFELSQELKARGKDAPFDELLALTDGADGHSAAYALSRLADAPVRVRIAAAATGHRCSLRALRGFSRRLLRDDETARIVSGATAPDGSVDQPELFAAAARVFPLRWRLRLAEAALRHLLTPPGTPRSRRPGPIKSRSPWTAVRMQPAARLLTSLGARAPIKRMLDVVREGRPRHARRMADALTLLAERVPAAPLRALLASPNDRLRALALRILGGRRRVWSALHEAVTDPSPRVRRAAGESLSRSSDARDVGRVLSLVGSRDRRVADAVANAAVGYLRRGVGVSDGALRAAFRRTTSARTRSLLAQWFVQRRLRPRRSELLAAVRTTREPNGDVHTEWTALKFGALVSVRRVWRLLDDPNPAVVRAIRQMCGYWLRNGASDALTAMLCETAEGADLRAENARAVLFHSRRGPESIRRAREADLSALADGRLRAQALSIAAALRVRAPTTWVDAALAAADAETVTGALHHLARFPDAARCEAMARVATNPPRGLSMWTAQRRAFEALVAVGPAAVPVLRALLVGDRRPGRSSAPQTDVLFALMALGWEPDRDALVGVLLERGLREDPEWLEADAALLQRVPVTEALAALDRALALTGRDAYWADGVVEAASALLRETEDERVLHALLAPRRIGGPWPANVTDGVARQARYITEEQILSWLSSEGHQSMALDVCARPEAARTEAVTQRLLDLLTEALSGSKRYRVEAIAHGLLPVAERVPRSTIPALEAVVAADPWRVEVVALLEAMGVRIADDAARSRDDQRARRVAREANAAAASPTGLALRIETAHGLSSEETAAIADEVRAFFDGAPPGAWLTPIADHLRAEALSEMSGWRP